MGRTVIVGDIHGCFDELIELLEKVELQPDDLLVSVGDLVDRGPAPGEVVGFFRERPNSVVVMGNHERKHVRGVFSYAQEITRLQMGDAYAGAVDWMRTLPYFFEDEHVRVVHAALVPGVPLADQREEVLCGSTSGERELAALFLEGHWHDHYTDGKPVVFGHHVTGREPLIRDGRVFGLDTGACHGWNLTALCVPGFTVHSVEAHADHWSAVKREWQSPVLRTKAWDRFTWSELDEKVARFSGTSDAASQEWLRAVGEWAAGMRALIPALVEAAHQVAGVLGTDEMRRHPAASVLFQARDGRLDLGVLAKRCTTPGRVLELSAALGVAAPEPPGRTAAGGGRLPRRLPLRVGDGLCRQQQDPCVARAQGEGPDHPVPPSPPDDPARR